MSPCNVLILGKAHIAAPRIALRRPDFSADIFAMPCHAMPGHSQIALELDGRTIVTGDDEVCRKMVYCNGLPDLPVPGCDSFVVIGGLAFHQLAGLQGNHRSADFPGAAIAIRAGSGSRRCYRASNP